MTKLQIFILVTLLSGCSLLGSNPTVQTSIAITIENQDRIRFSGKGAGTGMMIALRSGVMNMV